MFVNPYPDQPYWLMKRPRFCAALMRIAVLLGVGQLKGLSSACTRVASLRRRVTREAIQTNPVIVKRCGMHSTICRMELTRLRGHDREGLPRVWWTC